VSDAREKGADPRRFGDFHLLRYFAAGGMADLYIAQNRRFGRRELVLKRIQARFLGDRQVVAMFIEEGRIAARLAHGNVVRVLEVGDVRGVHYIAMEHVRGHDLAAIAQRAAETGPPIPRAVAVRVVAQVAAALAYIHTRADGDGRPLGIVHCDVSPGNVVVSRRGVAKLVDFGVARSGLGGGAPSAVAGKYAYMAPEQVRGEPFDGRADLFPLGTLLHELTTSGRLFRGRPEQVIDKVLREPIPPPSQLIAGYPPELERIVLGLLERDPGRRYPSAQLAHDDLAAYLAAEEARGSERDVASYLATLFVAPGGDVTDPSVFLGDDQTGPSALARHSSQHDDGPTAAIALPREQVQRERMLVERTEIVRAPRSGRGRPPVERTVRVGLPGWTLSPPRLSTAAVLCACGAALALLFLLAAWIAGRMQP